MASEGERFGKYELLRRLGHGGMAEVYLARQDGPEGFAKQVVLKQVLPQHLDKANFRSMFLDEARLAARLSHPNICQVFDLGEVDGRFFLAMEYVDGLTVSHLLSSLTRRGLRMPLDATLRVVSAVLEALHAAHTLTDEAGSPLQVVHRDVTPSNVMVTAQGSVKLLDFGIARMRGRSTETRVGMAKGKLGYMAPEQVRSQPLDARTDVFQVGAVLYQLVLGRGPYADSIGGQTIFDDMAATRFPPPRQVDATVPEPLEAIILTAMRARPGDRFQTALDMHSAIEAFAREQHLSLGPKVLTTLVQGLGAEPSGEEAVLSVDSGDLIEPVTATVKERPERDTMESGPVPAATASVEVTVARRAARPSALVLVTIAVAAVGVGLGGMLAMPMAAPTESSLMADAPGPEPTKAPPTRAPTRAAPAGESPPAAAPPPETTSPTPSPPRATEAVQLPTAVPALTDVVPSVEAIAERPVRGARTAPSRPSSLAPTDGPTGDLEVRCEPAAKVRIAGRLVGMCPVTVALAEGMHRVVLEYPGVSPRTLMVTVMPGVTTPLFDRK
jgi:serine/threonine protein kinase